MSAAGAPAALRRRVGLEVGATLVLGAAFSLPSTWTGAWWLQFLCIGLLVWRVGRAAPAHAAWLGLAFGTGWLCAGTWWLFISLHRYGGLPAPLAVLAVLALSVALSAYLAAALALFARLRRGRAAPDALLFAALWLAAELARGVLFTGFPWAATGYGQVDAPLATLAPWLGVYGIGFVLAAGAAGPALAFHSGPRQAALATFGVAALLVVLPWGTRDFSTPAGTLGVTLVQTNVAQDEKFAPDRLPEALSWLEAAMREARGPLVIAPETAIPLLPDQLGPETWRSFTALFGGERAALVGLPLGSFDAGYTNSVAGLSAQARALPGSFYRYDKQHLVPFGEFIPPGFHWFVEMMDIPLGDFARGAKVPPSFGFGGQRVAPNVCYEDLFGEELALRFADADQAPTVFANLSNIGWFGDTIAITQHLHISRMRTLELQRPMLRATNTGATALVDHRGRVTAQLAPFTRGALNVTVEGRSGVTPFAHWAGTFGIAPLVALSLLVVAVAGRWMRAP
ncbi:MAG: apolipoprotein N-acyltransferase [Pseudomonadota bacterium]